MTRNPPTTGSSEIRGLRLRLQLSQPQFAALLGVSAETYRTWDSGRRVVPDAWLAKAREMAAIEDPGRLWSLQELATELGVHVRTLRDAARSGRLEVTYENQVVFRNPVPRSTIAAGRAFMERYYRQSYSRYAPKPRPLERTCVPSDWARQLLRGAKRRGFKNTDFLGRRSDWRSGTDLRVMRLVCRRRRRLMK